MKNKAKNFAFPVLAVLTVSAFPSLFLYCRNADEAGFSEIVPALLLSAVTGLVLFGLAFLFTRSPGKAALSASLLMLVVLNFTFLENGLKFILPRLKYWHTVPIILVIVLHIIYFLCRYLKSETAGDVSKVLCLVFGGLIVLNVATSTPQIINHVKAQRELKEALAHREEQQGTAAEDMPNVYLLIFDEYANFPQMEEYYNYDNAPLREFLEEHNFNISYSSHNESIMSSTIQTNMMNLDYVVDNYTSESNKEVLRKNGTLFEIMREHGYQINIWEGGGEFYGGTLPTGIETASYATTVNGESLSSILQFRSVMYPFIQDSANGASIMDEHILIQADYLSNPANLPKGNTFTLSYSCTPHQPFFVDEYGNINPSDSWSNWQDKQYYLGQYKYVTKQMIRMAKNIVEHDPNAIIILQSDHGARASTDSEFTKRFPLEIMNMPLETVYYQGKEFDIEGLSSINVLRSVINELFGMEYEMLPVPEDTYDYLGRRGG